ncbi:hypothetical protein [Nakamurella leprariae]|uniref:Uncharacterized protein n=1 Tax=Nakamurella leprariae TaxID=2803911 RepID=A0A938YCU8_9ACTN|nr:hypothetical protein [Nakamurella leprariae]MBM9467263.1 hypothetical protein [Nakamurella leprariae]
MLVDIVEAAAAWRRCTVAATPEAADWACQAAGSFTGVDLLTRLLPAGVEVGAWLPTCEPLSVAEALTARCAVLQLTSGRLAVVAAPGVVVEPAGRRWAAVTGPPATRYASAWWPATVTRTLRSR